MIYPTANISFPRSGHHALKAVLGEYFGDQFVCCDNYYSQPEDRLGINPKTKYQKEHDLDLTYPQDMMEVKYLIQVRNPIKAIESWIDFDSRTLQIPIVNRKEWQISFQSKLDFWHAWFSKWVVSDIPHSRLVVPYSHLIQMPYRTCENVIQFITGRHVDPKKLASALERFPLIPRPTRYSTFIGVD